MKLVDACPELDSIMKVSVGDIGICTCNSSDDVVNVRFGKTNYPYILCSRLAVVGNGLPTEIEKFNHIIDIAIEEYDSSYSDEINCFVEFLRNKITEVDE